MKLRDAGFSVLAPDYRCFGRSDGDLPSESSAYEDAEAAWHELARRAPTTPRFIYGHSLGGAIAIKSRAAAQRAGCRRAHRGKRVQQRARNAAILVL